MLNKRFSEATVGDACDCVKDVLSKVVKKDDIKDAIDKMLEHPGSRTVYVVDEHDRYLGVLNAESVLRLLVHRAGVEKLGSMMSNRFLVEAFAEDVEDIMTTARTMRDRDTLSEAMEIMYEEHLDGLPVVDDEGKLVGELACLELFRLGRQLLEKGEMP